MPVKTSQHSAAGELRAQTGYVLEIDSNGIALVRMYAGNQERVRADMLRGKSAPPLPGETWILDRQYGLGWQFAIPVNWSPDRDWIAPAMLNSWASVGAPYLPVGYRRTADGEVLLSGRMGGGVGATTAFVLPLGYRPGGSAVFVVPVVAGTGQLTVDATGAVIPASTGATSIDVVRFMAAG
jgi:hypothetical protein